MPRWLPHDGLRESRDKRGRVRLFLGKGHPYANTGGWQYRYRYMMMEYLGRKLREDEHVHHINGIKDDDRFGNFELWLAEQHGRYHACIEVLGRFRDDLGRFVCVGDEDERTPGEDEIEEVLSVSQESLESVPF